MQRIINILLFVWQFPQILIGWIVSLFYKVKTTILYKDKTVRICPTFPGGISLGNTVIVKRYPFNTDTWNTVKHEWGHTVQSKILGPFYLFVVGIPSLLWAALQGNVVKKDCSWFYTEKWADKIGNVKK